MIEFDLNTVTGLSEGKAARRLSRDGFNELPTTKQRGLFGIARELVREPMFLLNPKRTM
jgi:P-type Ca2+ transporter type 2C